MSTATDESLDDAVTAALGLGASEAASLADNVLFRGEDLNLSASRFALVEMKGLRFVELLHSGDPVDLHHYPGNFRDYLITVFVCRLNDREVAHYFNRASGEQFERDFVEWLDLVGARPGNDVAREACTVAAHVWENWFADAWEPSKDTDPPEEDEGGK